MENEDDSVAAVFKGLMNTDLQQRILDLVAKDLEPGQILDALLAQGGGT